QTGSISNRRSRFPDVGLGGWYRVIEELREPFSPQWPEFIRKVSSPKDSRPFASNPIGSTKMPSPV
ncbi:MAG: hypothetical protein KDA81_18445, partial [Planctomycetaceae bacterium]|nr:hypothetical protein [Planctomycetaceae bacterium]